MFDSYDDAADATITQRQAMAFIVRHDIGEPNPCGLFLLECGDHPTYAGSVVLNWLGY